MLVLNGKTDATLKALRTLQLTEYESKVYFTLLVIGEAKPGEIVRLSGVPQSRVYYVVRDLVEKKVVVQTQARPLMVKPVDLDIVLAQIKAEKMAEFNKTVASANFISEVLWSLRKVAQQYEGQFKIFEPNRREVIR
jgi:sugar-specific transcriptional regulator TrmB